MHSTLDGSDAADFKFMVRFNGREHSVAVRQRPFLFEFLERVAQLFEVVVFTASQKVYAEQLLNILDSKRYQQHQLNCRLSSTHEGVQHTLHSVRRGARAHSSQSQAPQICTMHLHHGYHSDQLK